MGSQTVQQQWLAAIRDGRDGLKAGSVAVLYTLATFMDADGRNCRPGVARVAEGARCTRTTAFEHLRKAAAAGWIEVHQRRGASVYLPCIGGVPLAPNPPPNRSGLQDGERPVDNANRPGTPNSGNRPGMQDGEAPTVRGFDANRPGFPDGTSFDQEVQLASSSKLNGDKADLVLAKHGIPLTDRPSLERFLREVRKATSPAGLMVVLDEQGRFAAVLPDWRTWAEPTLQPPHVNGTATATGCDRCDRGWIEQPDERLARCPACQPQPVNGHHR